MNGLFVTIQLTVLSCIIGTLLSVPLAIGLRSKSVAVRRIAEILTIFGKGTPLLVLLVWVHYVAPTLMPLPISAFWSSIVALSFNLAAYLGDLLRGGAESIPEGHIESAYAIGLSHWQVVRRVIIPETIRRIFPAMSAFYISVLQLSTLASMIGTKELLFSTRIVNSDNPHPFELYSALAGTFLILVLLFSKLSRNLEQNRWFALYPKTK
jgi:polar amino acid transport system permease protein